MRQQAARDAVNAAAIQEQNRRLAQQTEENIRAQAHQEMVQGQQIEYKQQQDYMDRKESAIEALGKFPGPQGQAVAMALMDGSMPVPPRLNPLEGMGPLKALSGEPTLDETLAPAMAMSEGPTLVLDEDPTLTPAEEYEAKLHDLRVAGQKKDLRTTTSSLDKFGLGGAAQAIEQSARMEQQSAAQDVARLAEAYMADPLIDDAGKQMIQQLAPAALQTYDGDEAKAAEFVAKEVKRLTDAQKKARRKGSGGPGRGLGKRTPENYYGIRLDSVDRLRNEDQGMQKIGGEIKMSRLQQQTASVEALGASYKVFQERGPKAAIAQRNAIKEFIKQTDSRITQQDYDLIAKGGGVWSALRSTWAENFSDAALDAKLDEIDPATLERIGYAIKLQRDRSVREIAKSYDQNARLRASILEHEKSAAGSGDWYLAAQFAHEGRAMDDQMANIYPAGLVRQRRAKALKDKYKAANP